MPCDLDLVGCWQREQGKGDVLGYAKCTDDWGVHAWETVVSVTDIRKGGYKYRCVGHLCPLWSWGKGPRAAVCSLHSLFLVSVGPTPHQEVTWANDVMTLSSGFLICKMAVATTTV